MSRNHDASIKDLKMKIGQLSRQVAAFSSSNGGFTGNTVDNPKNERCKVMDTCLRVIIKKDKDHIFKEEALLKHQSLPAKLKDLGKFTISCNIGGMNILHALCDLGSSINVMPLKTVKELKVGEITPSNMSLTLDDLSITQPIAILRDMLVHVVDLVFPIDFVVLDTKGNSRGYVILRRTFLATGKVKIDVEMGGLILKFNKRKVVFKV
ncbi:uncharacterized protein LOC127104852 [Lathyrus oleraceus]|uniref:uncharacterized protein LOC127104852 n=1 Tax=Pisum sativum TaxID=3888 RepID=UPI0021D3CD0A|nr:uncharacterized protein LOC127104852 [Pisum sativum]